MSTARVHWSMPIGSPWDEFDVYSREQGASTWTARGSTRAMTLDLPFPDYGTYDIAIAPRARGIQAPPDRWTTLTFSPGDTSGFPAIATPTNFRAAQDGQVIRAAWDPPTDTRIDHHEIRAGTSWEAGLVMARVPAGLNEAVFAPWSTGAVSLHLKARSKHGTESSAIALNPSLSVVADQYGPVQGTHDEHGGGYAGSKSDVEVSGSDLVQSPIPLAGSDWTSAGSSYTYPPFGRYRTGGTYTTDWQDAGAVVEERIEVAVTLALTKVMPTGDKLSRPVRRRHATAGAALDEGERSIFSYIKGNGTIVDGLELQVEIDTAQDTVPTSQGFRRWVPGTVYRYREVRLRFTFVCPWTFAYLKTTAMTWYRRRQNRKDEGELVISGTGGTDVTFASGRFTAAPKLTGNLIHATNVGIVTFSNVTASGCKARVYDAAGAETTGTIHWHALGV